MKTNKTSLTGTTSNACARSSNFFRRAARDTVMAARAVKIPCALLRAGLMLGCLAFAAANVHADNPHGAALVYSTLYPFDRTFSVNGQTPQSGLALSDDLNTLYALLVPTASQAPYDRLPAWIFQIGIAGDNPMSAQLNS